MIVIKVDPNWFPSENPSLQVGDTIDMGDPSVLLRNGTVKLPESPEITIEHHENISNNTDSALRRVIDRLKSFETPDV